MSNPLRLGSPIPPLEMARIQRHLHLECNKWDTQVGDHLRAAFLITVKVDVAPIINALAAYAEPVSAAGLVYEAPPAFLLDENRAGSNGIPNREAGYFDNRSFISESDFPSADYLRQQGISQVILLQKKEELQADLKRVLLAWQTGGLAVARQEPTAPWNPQSIQIKPPTLIQRLWHRFNKWAGMAKYPMDNFGEFVPPHAS